MKARYLLYLFLSIRHPHSAKNGRGKMIIPQQDRFSKIKAGNSNEKLRILNSKYAVLSIATAYCLLLMLTATFIGCSTKRNTIISRSYHNLTSHYNAYYNGKESYKQGLKRINANPSDDYSLVLNILALLNNDAAKQASSDMNRVKEKAAIVIKKHSITVKPKRKNGNQNQKEKDFYNRTEFCNWVDDSWLLNGKANFVNHDWYAAEENFEYIVKEYSWSSIQFEASIWLALTYVQLNKYDDAKALLDRADGDKDFPKKLRKFLNQSYVQLYVKQQKYDEAISKLHTAFAFIKNHQEKARSYYILAQLYQINKQLSKASEAYTKAIKYGNKYDMVFNAQINRATCFDMASGNAEQIRKELYKMLKDDKNLDYYDQIYYAIANLYYKENNTEQAIKNYKLSILNTKNNNHQKAISYMSLGDIYLAKKSYIFAQAYFDSSISLMGNEYPEYNRVKNLSNNLSTLASNLLIVQNEDSLQKIAKLPENERNKIIDDIIQKLVEEEKRKQEEQQQQANNMMFMNNQNLNPLTNQTSGGKWYFYNPATLSMGMAEFKRKWGNRKLEDDWRRKNKSVTQFASTEDSTQSQSSNKQQTPASNPKQREYYTCHLPLTDSLMKNSNKKLEDALFKSGEAAMNQLSDYPLAIQQFIRLTEQFPKSEYKLITYYNLYNLNLHLNKQDEATVYKNKIIQEFPDSKYAQMLTNPNYLQELEAKLSKIKSLYEETYSSFKEEDYPHVFSYCSAADSLYHESPLLPKFKLLKAMSFALTGNIPQYKKELSDVIEKYPGTLEKQNAEQLLATVNSYDPNYLASINQPSKKSNSQQTTNNTQNTTQQNATINKTDVIEEEKEDPLFVYDEKDTYQFIILLDKNADLNRLKYNLFGYNIDYFSMFDFQILNGTWNDKYYYIKVFPFSTINEAIKYYKHVNKNSDVVFRSINDKQYQFFVISDANYTKLQSSGEIEHYLKFFKHKYLKKKKQ
jgi:TolA-binding protein